MRGTTTICGRGYNTSRRQPSAGRVSRDPLVPIDAQRLKVALALKGRTEKGAARDLERRGLARVSQQGLNVIVGGRRKRCRQSLREGLATLLGPPFTPVWLGGEGAITDVLPNLEEENKGWVTGWLEKQSPLELRVLGLKQAVWAAWQRDGLPDHEPIPGITTNDFIRNIPHAASLGYWRAAALIGPIEAHTPEDQTFGIAVIDAMRAVLEPWLEGRSAINVDALNKLGAILRLFLVSVVNSITMGEEVWKPEIHPGSVTLPVPDWSELVLEGHAKRISKPRKKRR